MERKPVNETHDAADGGMPEAIALVQQELAVLGEVLGATASLLETFMQFGGSMSAITGAAPVPPLPPQQDAAVPGIELPIVVASSRPRHPLERHAHRQAGARSQAPRSEHAVSARRDTHHAAADPAAAPTASHDVMPEQYRAMPVAPVITVPPLTTERGAPPREAAPDAAAGHAPVASGVMVSTSMPEYAVAPASQYLSVWTMAPSAPAWQDAVPVDPPTAASVPAWTRSAAPISAADRGFTSVHDDTSVGPQSFDGVRTQQSPADAERDTRRGTIILDGAQLGRWVIEHLARNADRPGIGMAGIDPRMSAGYPGAPTGA